MTMLKRPLRQLATLPFRSVLYSHVYTLQSFHAAPTDPLLEKKILPDGRVHFGLREGDRLLCECYFIDGDAYRDRFPWKLGARDAVLVRLLTDPAARGRGLAPSLIAEASATMASDGFERLYAMLWHNNAPSKRAFHKAGWSRIARHLTVNFRYPRRRIDLVWPTGKSHGVVGS
jgi:RimJ/RimL family protein N-acetyltransferase